MCGGTGYGLQAGGPNHLHLAQTSNKDPDPIKEADLRAHHSHTSSSQLDGMCERVLISPLPALPCPALISPPLPFPSFIKWLSFINRQKREPGEGRDQRSPPWRNGYPLSSFTRLLHGDDTGTYKHNGNTHTHKRKKHMSIHTTTVINSCKHVQRQTSCGLTSDDITNRVNKRVPMPGMHYKA